MVIFSKALRKLRSTTPDVCWVAVKHWLNWTLPEATLQKIITTNEKAKTPKRGLSIPALHKYTRGYLRMRLAEGTT